MSTCLLVWTSVPRADLVVDQNDVPISRDTVTPRSKKRKKKDQKGIEATVRKKKGERNEKGSTLEKVERKMEERISEFKFRILSLAYGPVRRNHRSPLVSHRMQFSVSTSFNFWTGSAEGVPRDNHAQTFPQRVYVSGKRWLHPRCKFQITL